MKKFILSLLGLMAMLPTFARDFEYTYEGQTITYTVLDEEEKTCYTKGGRVWEIGYGIPVGGRPGNQVEGILYLPANPMDGGNKFTLVGIGDASFLDNEITSVSIPNSVQWINEAAFAQCEYLSKVSLPSSSLELIYDYAFYRCHWLESIEIPDSVTSIGTAAFRGCSGLTSVKIGKSVYQISFLAFSECSGLTSVIIPQSVQRVGINAFEGCSNLKKSAYPTDLYIFNYGDEEYQSNPFYDGFVLKYNPSESIIENGWIYGGDKKAIYFAPIDLKGEFIVPESTTKIGNGAFLRCSGLTSINIPESVTSIGTYTFMGCSRLTSINIPESVTSIGTYTFMGCSRLTSVEIPNLVTKIGESAFQGCSSFKDITIPNRVTEIGKNAFGNTSLIKAAYPDQIENPFDSSVRAIAYDTHDSTIEDGIVYSRRKDKLFYVPTSVEGSFEIPESVEELGEYVFYKCSGLTSVEIPSSITEIGTEAWGDCNNIKEVTCMATTPIEAPKDIFTPTVYDEATLFVPIDCGKSYEKALPWKYFYDIQEKELSGINAVEAITDADAEIYTLSGLKATNSADSLQPGIYIIRQGEKIKKIVVK